MHHELPSPREEKSIEKVKEGRVQLPPLVSIVIPAYNAAGTIEETLHSACAQTWRDLQIIVVDDGSNDETAEIVRRLADRDCRIRLVQTPNRGVAAARNEGIRASRAEYIAMLDADDLWHPTKIERQMQVMLAGPVQPGFVYCLYRNITATGCVTYSSAAVECRGNVLARHAYMNFVGNGSALLLRRAAIEAAGGYDPGLRARGIEGCEDLLLQLRIASRFNVDCVPEYLVGYRQHVAMMSFDQARMLRSRRAALALVREVAPDVPEYVFRWSVAQQLFRTALSNAGQRRWGGAARMLALSILNDPLAAWPKLWALLQPSPEAKLRFADYLPSQDTVPPSRLLAFRLRRLAKIDNVPDTSR